jgi:hypothetical protein
MSRNIVVSQSKQKKTVSRKIAPLETSAIRASFFKLSLRELSKIMHNGDNGDIAQADSTNNHT